MHIRHSYNYSSFSPFGAFRNGGFLAVIAWRAPGSDAGHSSPPSPKGAGRSARPEPNKAAVGEDVKIYRTPSSNARRGEYPLIRKTLFGERGRSDMRIVRQAACRLPEARVKWGKGQSPFRIFSEIRKKFTKIFYETPETQNPFQIGVADAAHRTHFQRQSARSRARRLSLL